MHGRGGWSKGTFARTLAEKLAKFRHTHCPDLTSPTHRFFYRASETSPTPGGWPEEGQLPAAAAELSDHDLSESLEKYHPGDRHDFHLEEAPLRWLPLASSQVRLLNIVGILYSSVKPIGLRFALSYSTISYPILRLGGTAASVLAPVR